MCKSKYPKLEAELRALETEENRGVLALLLDTLLDLDLIKEQLATPQSDVPGSSTEGGRDCNHDGEQNTLLSARASPRVSPNAERDSESDPRGRTSLELKL